MRVRLGSSRLAASIETVWPATAPILVLLGMDLAVEIGGSPRLQRTVTDMLISVILVVGLYVFTGNSGVLSFGHMSFMAVGAYTTALLTIPPAMKQTLFNFPGYLEFLYNSEWSSVGSIAAGAALAAMMAMVVGLILMRLSGIEAAIGILALLLIVNVIISNWNSVTRGVSAMIGVPQFVTPRIAFVGAALAIVPAYWYQTSSFGKRLRASREDENAAAVLGINIVRERWIAFALSAAIVGMGGALYAHFAVVFTPSQFFLKRTFLMVAMLIIGGMQSLAGAVTGVVVISTVAEFLRQLESGIALGGAQISSPTGTTEVVLGLLMLLALAVRPRGLLGGREIRWPFSRRSQGGDHFVRWRGWGSRGRAEPNDAQIVPRSISQRSDASSAVRGESESRRSPNEG